MALGVYFAPASLIPQQYDESIKQLKSAGAGHPAGRRYHTAFGSPDKLMVFEVWTTQAAFEAFGQTLMPILQKIGIDPGQPQIMAIHNVIVPPAARPAAKKAAKKSVKKAVKKVSKKPVKKSKARRR